VKNLITFRITTEKLYLLWESLRWFFLKGDEGRRGHWNDITNR